MSETESTAAATEEAATEVPETDEGKTFDLAYVQNLRQEAAKHRNAKNEAVEAAKAAVAEEWQGKLTERDTEISELRSESLGKDATLAKLNAAITARVPVEHIFDVAELAKGSTEEEITESVNKIVGLSGGFTKTDRPTDPTQGSGGKPPALNSDKLLSSLKAAVGAS